MSTRIAELFHLEDQRGITGFEAVLVLVALVVIAAVISLVIVNTGLFSSDESERAVLDPPKAPPEDTPPPDIQGTIAAAVRATRQAVPTPIPTTAPAPTLAQTALPARNPAVMGMSSSSIGPERLGAKSIVSRRRRLGHDIHR